MSTILLPAHAHDPCRFDREALEVSIFWFPCSAGLAKIIDRYNPAERDRSKAQL